MFTILKREMFWFAVSALILMPAALIAGYLAAGEISPLAAGMNNVLLFAAIVGPVFLAEQALERGGPGAADSPRSSVWVTFGLPLGTAVLCVAESLAALRHLNGPEDLITLTESSALVSGAVALLAAGLVRLGVLWLGFYRASVSFFVVVMMLPVAAALGFGANLGNTRELASQLAQFLMSLNQLVFALWASGVYLLLVPVALLLLRCRGRR